MATPELLASCWTHAGDAAPMRGDERSPFDILDRVAAVGAAGWAGIGFVHADLVVARDTIGYPALRSAIADAGIRHTEVEFLGDWWDTGDARAASDAIRTDLLEAIEALGARTIKAAGKMWAAPDEVDLDVMRTEFDALATQVGARGARIALEALPFTNFATIGAGSDFVASVGNPSGGLCVDLWHVYRGGNTPEDLRADVDPAVLFAVELNDALEPAPADLWADTINERRLPGEGSWDVPGFINVIRDLGFAGPWGVEILATTHRAKSLHDEVTSAFAATITQFALADSAR